MEMRSHLDIKVAIRVSQPKSSPLEIFGKSIFAKNFRNYHNYVKGHKMHIKVFFIEKHYAKSV